MENDDNIPKCLQRPTFLLRLSDSMVGRGQNPKDDFETVYEKETEEIKSELRVNSEEVLEIKWDYLIIRMPIREWVDVFMKLHPNWGIKK